MLRRPLGIQLGDDALALVLLRGPRRPRLRAEDGQHRSALRLRIRVQIVVERVGPLRGVAVELARLAGFGHAGLRPRVGCRAPQRMGCSCPAAASRRRRARGSPLVRLATCSPLAAALRGTARRSAQPRLAPGVILEFFILAYAYELVRGPRYQV